MQWDKSDLERALWLTQYASGEIAGQSVIVRNVELVKHH